MINDILGYLMGGRASEKIAEKENLDASKVASLTQLAIPEMLKALQNNVQTEEGNESLNKALEQHQPSSFNIFDIMDQSDDEDNEKILGHMFGDQKDNVIMNLSSQSGLDLGDVLNLIKKYAPLVLGALSLQKSAGNILGGLFGSGQKSTSSKSNDLGGLIGSMLGSSNKQKDVLGQVTDIIGGFLKK